MDRSRHALETASAVPSGPLETAPSRPLEKGGRPGGAKVPRGHIENAKRRHSAGNEKAMISGADMMREIDLSILTWCSDHDPDDAIFHGALLDPKAPTDEELNLGWRNFFEMTGREPKALREVVFRRPTWEHVPEHYGWREVASPPALKPRPGTGLPFQPFEHWRYVRNCPRCVLRSNWIGRPEGGRFRTPTDEPGRLTDELGRMIIELVERYGSRGNWRGYTHIGEMKADARLSLATNILKFNPLKSSNPIAYASQSMNTAFINSKNGHAEVWSRERYLGDAEIGENGEGFEAADGETFAEAAEREMVEGQRHFFEGE